MAHYSSVKIRGGKGRVMREPQGRAADAGKGALQDTGQREADPAWRAGALFITSAKPEFSAYFWAGYGCGFDAFAVQTHDFRLFPDTRRLNPTFCSTTAQTRPLD